MDIRRRHMVRAMRTACLGVLTGAAACVSLGRETPVRRQFVLGGGPRAEAAARSEQVADVTVGVRRLKLAAYLASPFIVVRRGPDQVGFSEVNRWGEPLDAAINRVVARYLVSRGFRDAVVVPWPAQARYDYVIEMEVVRFEGLVLGDSASTEGAAHMLATWSIVQPQDGTVLARGTTDYQRPGWKVGDYPGLVSMLDGGLDVLSGDLTASLATLVASRRPPQSPGRAGGPSPRSAGSS